MSKGIGITELTTILNANPRMVGAVREQEKVGFLSTPELEALLAGSVATAEITDLAVSTAKLAPDAITSPKLDGSTIQYAVVELDAAAILTLNAAPVELVAAPAAGNVLEFISLQLAFDWVGVAYTVVGCTNLQVHYTNGAGVAVSVAQAAAGFLDGVADDIRLLDKLEASVTPVDAAPLVLAMAGADPAAGDSIIHAKVAYRVHATGL